MLWATMRSPSAGRSWATAVSERCGDGSTWHDGEAERVEPVIAALRHLSTAASPRRHGRRCASTGKRERRRCGQSRAAPPATRLPRAVCHSIRGQMMACVVWQDARAASQILRPPVRADRPIAGTVDLPWPVPVCRTRSFQPASTHSTSAGRYDLVITGWAAWHSRGTVTVSRGTIIAASPTWTASNRDSPSMPGTGQTCRLPPPTRCLHASAAGVPHSGLIERR